MDNLNQDYKEICLQVFVSTNKSEDLDNSSEREREIYKIHRRRSQCLMFKKNTSNNHMNYTCELDPDNPCDEGIMGTGRLFLLTAGSGGADVGGAMSRAGGERGTARFFFPGGMGAERWLRIPWATFSMSSTVVCMASAISSLVWDTKLGSLARETRPPLTRAWGRRTNSTAANGVNLRHVLKVSHASCLTSWTSRSAAELELWLWLSLRSGT